MQRLKLLGVGVGVALPLLAAVAAGCDRHSPSEPDSRDSISLVSVAPASGTRLVPGAAASFTAVVDYQLHSQSLLGGDRGTIALDVEDQDGRLLDAEVRKTVDHGQGSTSLSDRVTLPANGVSQVKLVVALIPDAIDAPTVVSVAATYPVRR
jgi:hypothetical protein